MLPVIRKVMIFTKIEIDIDTIGSIARINFKPNNELRNVKLWGVQSYYRYSYSKTPTLIKYESGQFTQDLDFHTDLINKDYLQRSFLNLYDTNGVNFLRNAPLPIFQTIENGQDEFYSNNGEEIVDRESTIVEKDNKEFNGQLLDLQNSYINIVWSGLDYKNPKVIPLEFYYSRIDLDNTTTKIK